MPFTILQKPSQNFSARGGAQILGVAIHIGQAPSIDSIMRTFQQVPSSNSSSHYAVPRSEGPIYQFVDESECAWHSGLTAACYTDPKLRPKWKLFNIQGFSRNPNRVLIGIENEGFSVEVTYGSGASAHTFQSTGDFTDWQYSANAWLVARAAKRWGFPINADTVVPHGMIYIPKADLCPGPHVSVDRIVREALAIDPGSL